MSEINLDGAGLSSDSSTSIPYDHQIYLIDSTTSTTSSKPPAPAGDDNSTPETPSGTLARKWTLREELARRKHAQWRDHHPPSSPDPLRPSVDPPKATDRVPTSTADSDSTLSTALPSQAQPTTSSPLPQSAIDILYENQRGSFLLGTPHFSHNSLLNLDPSPWSTATLANSSVDIHTFQLPDPTTWRWAWKRWYVDMSGDVDDEGWQYSFSFSPRFGWAGAPVWWHAWVRRRRWIRKRIRRHLPFTKSERADATADYFTILSSSSSGPRRQPQPRQNDDDDDNLEDDLLTDVASLSALLRALKHARIDREKLLAISSFVANERAAAELAHLAECMPALMQSLTFQASRRQLAAELVRAYHAEEEGGEGAARRESLARASEAAEAQVRRLQYWSDVRGLVSQGETKGGVDPSEGWDEEAWVGVDESGPRVEAGRPLPGDEDEVVGEGADGVQNGVGMPATALGDRVSQDEDTTPAESTPASDVRRGEVARVSEPEGKDRPWVDDDVD